MKSFTIAVEGNLDEVVARRIMEHCGRGVARVFGRAGRPHLLEKVSAYAKAAQFSPWFMLVDLDRDPCAPGLVASVPEAEDSDLILRVAVREVEAWLLADARSVAAMLGVSTDLVPRDPEALNDPKQALVNLARRSRFKNVRSDLVPAEGSGRSEGPGYTARLGDFVRDSWNVESAAEVAPSLARCIAAIGD